jgi:NAD(P)-dependent dehydrogenase (short-subunit alcohol dehydrogenase family)
VLTGAGRGLGALIAHAFSHAGAKVALVSRTERDLKAVADALPGPTLVFCGDVRDAEFNEAVADGTMAEWGGVDVWICNAGISPVVAGPLRIEPAVWRDVIDINLTGAFLGARAAARVMRDGGRLIFTGSVLGERPSKGRRVQRFQGRDRGHGKGLSARSRPVGHHGQCCRTGLVRFAIGGGVDEQRPTLGVDPWAYGAQALGTVR